METAGKTVHEVMATERDLENWIGELEVAQAEYETAKADANATSKDAKKTLDKKFADAVEALKSRKFSKAALKDLLAMKKRQDTENSDDLQAKLWGMRALGIKPAQRVFMFDTEVRDEADVLEKAEHIGFDDGKHGRPMDLAYPSNQPIGQRYLKGYQRGQASNVPGADSSKTTAAVH